MRLLKMGTVLAAGTMLALLALAPSALATVPPVTQLTAAIGLSSADGDYPWAHLTMVVPDFSLSQYRGGEVLVMISPTRYFSEPTVDALQDDERALSYYPDAPGPFVCDWGDGSPLTVVEGQSYKFSVFCGVTSYESNLPSVQWSTAATTAAVAYLSLPEPTPLKLHSFWLDPKGSSPCAYSVHLDPGDVLDVFLSDPRGTMALFPPGTTVVNGQVAQQEKRTLWNEKGAGFVYQVPADGPSGDYILYPDWDDEADHIDGWTVLWNVTPGTGRFSIAVPSRKFEQHPQSHVPLQYLCKGTVDPVAAWTGLCWLRVDIYATYGGETRWWIGDDYGKDARNAIDVRSTGHFTAWVRPFENFPGGDVPSTSHAAEKWRGTFKYRFSVESYAGYAGAYSPVYSGTWSGPQYR